MTNEELEKALVALRMDMVLYREFIEAIRKDVHLHVSSIQKRLDALEHPDLDA